MRIPRTISEESASIAETYPAPALADHRQVGKTSMTEKTIPSHRYGELFSTGSGNFENPLILFIDEFDNLPSDTIDRLVGFFRDIYLDRQNFLIHGLALVGVHAVLGIDRDRSSPFNVQRSLQVPKFTSKEVEDLFGQYRRESG